MHWKSMSLAAVWLMMSLGTPAQTVAAIDSGSAVVPTLVRFTGAAPGHAGERLSLEFSIYAAPDSGSALWSERQGVQIGGDGGYTVLLGAGSSIALPTSVFAAGEARWLGVRIGSGDELPRVLLSSVPYAMKAADADTLAGLKASDFLTQDEFAARLKQAAADQVKARPQTAGTETTTPATPTGGGTAGYLPLWSGAETLANSGLFQKGSGVNAEFGIGTTSPAVTLDVNGPFTSRGVLRAWNTVAVESNAVATAAAGVSSPMLELVGSAFNSGTATAAPQRFAWQVAATGNNTAAPSASLNLLYGTGGPAPTGLSISPKGILTFAPGQTFPGAVSTAGSVNASSYDLNGSLFAYGGGNGNAFLGYAGSGTPASGGSNTAVGTSSLTALTSGFSNSALGFAALHNNSSGGSNTAMGALALEFNSTGNYNNAFGGAALNSNNGGSWNNAFGGGALRWNINGTQNTAIGDNSGPDSASTGLINSTAIGANATVSRSYSLVLGQTTAGSPGASHVNVGIGTATPATAMEISVNAPNALGPILTLTNPGGTTSPYGYPASEASVDFKTYLHSSTANSPTSRIVAIDQDYGNELSFLVKQAGADNNPLLEEMVITDQGVDVDNYLYLVGPFGIYATPPTVADFEGSVTISGDLWVDSIHASVKDFLIDHPSDPANKYLAHASVESSEMMNIYSGNAVTDELGLATVKLPDWFQAENTDFRYQLTTIGRDAHAWVAKEVGGGQFQIATNATFVKVSWQITAVRQDAYAKAHPLVVEQEKPANERGFYIHPELHGQPQEKQLQWARQPDRMRRGMKQQQAMAAAAARRTASTQ
ncbi:MAG TPA: hypothetical protein VG267_03710 [Terracidiphilus sp.]|jgi:hypothetical protein|nr:hypothetical protein [Terracidiphilus sp.]